MLHVILPSEILGMLFYSSFLSHLMFIHQILLFIVQYPFSTRAPFPLTSLPKNAPYFLIFLKIYFCLYMACVEQLEDDGGWYEQFSAIWRLYLLFCIHIVLSTFFSFCCCFFTIKSVIVSLPSFFRCCFCSLFYICIFKLFLNLSINQVECSTIPACPSSTCFFNKGNIKENIFKNMFHVCMCMLCGLIW